MSGILVVAEHKNNKFKKITFEAITCGRKLSKKLNTDLIVAILGDQLSDSSIEFSNWGVNKIIFAENRLLKTYTDGSHVNVLSDIIDAYKPDIVLLGGSYYGRDIAPRLAAKLDVGLVNDCVALNFDENNNLVATRPMYAGKVLADLTVKESPKIFTIRQNVFPVEEKKGISSIIENFEVRISPKDIHIKIKDVISSLGNRIELTSADIIVSGGWGMKKAENFKILDELADVLGASVGASRAAVDSGWKPHEFQIGQTGKTVSPTVYIACGISGAVQHLAGMSSSKCIFAINKDPEAPIFKIADYGIIGDLFEIVPLLTKELHNIKDGIMKDYLSIRH